MISTCTEDALSIALAAYSPALDVQRYVKVVLAETGISTLPETLESFGATSASAKYTLGNN